MVDQIVAMVASVAVSVAVLLGGTDGPARRDSTCEARCYRAKSRAYQACRQIPAVDREAREQCFRQADAALQQCLRGCR